MYVSTRELPSCVEPLLAARGYYRKDIDVQPVERVSLCDGGADGRRAFVLLVNLETRKSELHLGSWGGANIFSPTNTVDLDTGFYNLPLNGMVIKGSMGNGTFASVYVHPDNLGKMLPMTEEVTQPERDVLCAYQRIKAGPYRREALSRVTNAAKLVEGLVRRGLLKQAKNGATQITTAGKNAVARAA